MMGQQIELFDEGGLKDEGGTKDPVSGNDVPSGSLQEEVRDDIDAKLSEGEFVFPADVVRYWGLETLMKMPRFDKKYVSPYHNEKPNAFRHDLRNIVDKFDLEYKVTPTIFRRTFATWLASIEGVTAQALKFYMGHQNIHTTMQYINEDAVIKHCEYIGDLDIDSLNKKVA